MIFVMYVVVLVGVCCLGLFKSGFFGLVLINVLLMVELFGVKEFVGIILLLLIVGDLIVYFFF